MDQIKLNWQQFRKGILKAEVVKSTNMNNIRALVQGISDQMKDNKQTGYIGVAVHYKQANHWTPSLFTAFGDKIKTFSQDMYHGDTDVYANDKPDRFVIYVNKSGNNKFYTPTKLATDSKVTKTKTKK